MKLELAPGIRPLNRVKGMLLGCAVGDALGYPLEGLARRQIINNFGRVTGFRRNPTKKMSGGQWSDDTALTLATAESLIEQRGLVVDDVRWRLRAALCFEPFRGFGPNTRKALEHDKINQRSSGAGAAMRISPVAIFSARDLELLRFNVTAASRLTHLHRDAVDGALAVAFAVAAAYRGDLIAAGLIQETIGFLGKKSEMGYKLREVEALVGRGDIRADEALDHIGTRGIALETVGAAFYAFLRTPSDFPASLLTVVNAGGDADTTGAITGAISGTYNGLEGIPRSWRHKVEKARHIECVAERLSEFV